MLWAVRREHGVLGAGNTYGAPPCRKRNPVRNLAVFCAADAFDICNGNRFDDRKRCDGEGCPILCYCGRVALRNWRPALDVIAAQTRMELEGLARAKFRLVEAFVRVIAKHRAIREATAFERALFPQSGLEFETSPDAELVFDEAGYAYNQPYKGGTEFKKHLFRVVGDLDASGEEFDCAVYLERCKDVKACVRNTVRQPNSFWLQTSSDKFYPDFVALLNDGRVLVVEYKGSHIATADDAKEKQLIGELWADRSNRNGVFLMIENREFSKIDRSILEDGREAGVGRKFRAARSKSEVDGDV